MPDNYRELKLACDLTTRVNRGETFDEVFRRLYDELRGLLPCERLAVAFLLPDQKTLILGPVRATRKILLGTGQREALADSCLQEVVAKGKPRSLDDLPAYAAKHPASKFHTLLAKEGYASSLAIPLSMGAQPLGVLWFASRTPAAYRPEHELFMRLIAGSLALIFERARVRSRLHIDDQRVAEVKELQARLEDERVELARASEPAIADLIGTSYPWRKTLKQAELVAASDATVLIRGETGTGKELIARAIHKLSPRAARPFIAVNCGALSAELLGSELFGHEKGAFTGAIQRRLGRMELAQGGTLFLDEIGEISPELQVKLLRFLQEREFERIGGTETLKADVRLIAATNRDLEQARTQGQFRDDLFFRLNVFPVRVPPLRERKEDLEPLLHYFLKRYAQKARKEFTSVDPLTLERCLDYHWPGNVRELENLVERGVILCPGREFAMDPLLESEARLGLSPRFATLDEAIREHLAKALKLTKGKIYGADGAAQMLKVKPSTLQAKLKKLGLLRSNFQ